MAQNIGALYTVKLSGASADVVAAVAGKHIRVVAFDFDAGANTAKFQSGGTTDLTGTMTGTREAVTRRPDFLFQTAKGEKLNVVVSAGAIQGFLTYFLASE